MFKASARPITVFFLVLTAFAGTSVGMWAQAADTTAVQNMVKRAVDLMDRNLGEQAVLQWDAIIALDPINVTYKYERAISLAMSKRYEEAIAELQPIYTDSALYDRGYQLMGNCYDYLENNKKSMEYYQAGFKKFPLSGRLHYEFGAAAFIANDVKKAIDWWIKGTRAEPWFATNYYWVAKTSAQTKDKIWMIFFGEAFINIEPATQRSKEIATMLFKAWTSSMRLGDPDDPINFCSDELLEAPSQFGPATMNFPTAFEFTIAQSSQQFIPDSGVLKKISIEQLVEIRKKFLDGWKGAGYSTKYPNDLITWNLKLKDAGWLTEYLWWLHGYGDMEEMRSYMQKNEARYDTFFGWFMQNPFVADHPLCLGTHCSD